MAVKKENDPNRNGLRGIVNQNLGKSEDGKGIIKKTVKGTFDGLHLWRKEEGSRNLAFYGAIMTAMLGAPFVDNQLEKQIDWAPEHVDAAVTTQDGRAIGYRVVTEADSEEEAHYYYLTMGGDGPVLMRSRDDNPNDDLFVRVTDPAEAARVTAEIAARLNSLPAGGYDYRVHDDDDAFVVTYDGISGVFENVAEGYGDTTYMIGDNVSDETVLTQSVVAEEQTRWMQATNMAVHGELPTHLEATLQGEHLDSGYNDFLVGLSMLGALAGLGAAGGAVSGVVGSRRRFRNEGKADHKKTPQP